MKTFTLETDGKGLWSKIKKKVKVTKVKYGKWDGKELCLYFNKKSWDVEKYGLIYTDRRFINDFRKYLISKGIPKKAAIDIDYTEQGMQGDDYVSLEYGKTFQNYLINKILGE